MGNSIVTKLSQPKGYQIGDEITVDGQKGYVAGVDESGKPTSISHSADNLRVEREQYASWDRDEYAQNYLRNLGLDTASMLRSMERTDTGLNYRHSFDSAIAMNLNPVYGQPEPMRNRGFMGRQLDSFNQWRDGVFNTYQDIAIQSGGGFMTGLVAAVETPTRLGLGVAEGALGLGGLLFDSSVRQDAVDGMSYLSNNYDTVVPGAFNRWMEQSWDRQLSDLFVLGGEGLLGGVSGKYAWQAGKYGVDSVGQGAAWAKKTVNYEMRHWFTGKQTLDADQTFYSYRNSEYFTPGSSFEPLKLWMTPELMKPEIAVQRLALEHDKYDTLMTINLPKGTEIMKPRTVWSLFGKPGGGIEVRNYQPVTGDMYSTLKLDELFRGK
uniref:Uncharacterized protein n=1 Tax=Rheinheimera sp. BAL341 TaxID=1708203 RepID=A0A486XVK8_9GAMM